MIPDGVPGLGHLPDQFWVLLGKLTNHEEGCVRLMSFKNLEKAGSELRVGPIIKRQGGNRLGCQDVGNGSRHVAQ
jgi:hypothetical protein